MQLYLIRKKFEEIKYDLSNKWNSFTYIFRKPYYRYRLHKRFKKYEYYGCWEVVNPMMEYPFEIFCEFYERCRENQYMGEDQNPDRREAMYEADILYKWWTIERHEERGIVDYLLHLWAERNVSWWVPCEHENFMEWKSISDKYTDYLFKLHGEEEHKFYEKENEMLMRLMKIRNYLWD